MHKALNKTIYLLNARVSNSSSPFSYFNCVFVMDVEIIFHEQHNETCIQLKFCQWGKTFEIQLSWKIQDVMFPYLWCHLYFSIATYLLCQILTKLRLVLSFLNFHCPPLLSGLSSIVRLYLALFSCQTQHIPNIPYHHKVIMFTYYLHFKNEASIVHKEQTHKSFWNND